MKRKKILLTNDDGFEAVGLQILRETLSQVAEVVTVAPTIEKSASSHSLTLTRPLRFVEVERNFYKLDDGTPTDCVFLALHRLFDEGQKPDLIVSGINRGANMGEDITYSGTVGAAMEGVLQGIPSIAVSQVCRSDCSDIVSESDYALAVKATLDISQKILSGGFPLDRRKLLNINVPPLAPDECKGVAVTHTGHRVYGNNVEKHLNPRGLEYYWIGLPVIDWYPRYCDIDGMSDFEAIVEGYISVTPIHLDLTSYSDIDTLKECL